VSADTAALRGEADPPVDLSACRLRTQRLVVTVDRRTFLRRAGLAAGGAAAGVAATGGAAEFHINEQLRYSAKAVGGYRPKNLTASVIAYRVPTTEPVVALTFDDGPSAAYTAKVLEILEREQVPATFNLIGRHVAALPELAEHVAAKHEVGNHTWSHPNLALARATAARDQLRRGADIIAEVTGRRPRIFRPPYGSISGATIMLAVSMGYAIVLWDFEFNQHGRSAAANVKHMTHQARPGSIILGHDGGTLNCDVVVEALPALIDRLRQRGLRFVTTSDLLALVTTERGLPASAAD
jgi:peptidoglycan/xylan/chitin deacetylase (PgdA/CDA1 family)